MIIPNRKEIITHRGKSIDKLSGPDLDTGDIMYLLHNNNIFIGCRTPWAPTKAIDWKKTNKNINLIEFDKQDRFFVCFESNLYSIGNSVHWVVVEYLIVNRTHE